MKDEDKEISADEFKCAVHRNIDCYPCLKNAVTELINTTMTTGMGGYVCEFGPILYGNLYKAVDPSKINKR
jgi:hypothetical protein